LATRMHSKNGNPSRLPFFVLADRIPHARGLPLRLFPRRAMRSASSCLVVFTGGLLAKPNYQFEKRQRDLAKKSKQEEKRRQKALAKAGELEPGESLAPSSEAPDSGPFSMTADVEDRS